MASQGKTVEEAIANLKEALELYYEDAPSDIVEPRQTLFDAIMEVSRRIGGVTYEMGRS